MIVDPEVIRLFYKELAHKVTLTRKRIGRPLTLTEKVLYSHLFDFDTLTAFKREAEYVDFRPDRVAMQDATAQMALLQFLMAGKDASAVPASVHCDHLIMAKTGSAEDLRFAKVNNSG